MDDNETEEIPDDFERKDVDDRMESGGNRKENQTEGRADDRQCESDDLVQPIRTVFLNSPQPVQSRLERNEHSCCAEQHPQQRRQLAPAAHASDPDIQISRYEVLVGRKVLTQRFEQNVIGILPLQDVPED